MRVSVIIDTFNYGRFVRQAVDSVLAQDFPKDQLEVVVVDDGSTDDTKELLAGYGDKIKYVFQQNSGQAAAFNAGFAASSGELLMLLDSDDYWPPEKVRLVVEQFSDPEVGIVQHPLRDVDVEGRPLPTNLPNWPARYALEDLLAGNTPLAAASGLALRKDLLAKIGPIPLDIRFASDIYLITHGLFFSKSANLPGFLGVHRIHGANNWAENYMSPKKLRTGLEIQKNFQRHLDARLRETGRALSPLYVRLEEMDVRRRELLLAVHEGRRRDAFAIWRGLCLGQAAGRFGLFRGATLALALVSPRLYVAVSNLYSRNRWLVRLREFLSPV
jgi:glycosyltransferase involved in cell wall biosynthesis